MLVEATSVLEDEPLVDVEPRGSLPCAAWKRDVCVFIGLAMDVVDALPAALVPIVFGSSYNVWSAAGAGVCGGEMNATFFALSASRKVLAFLLELRPFDSPSRRGLPAGDGACSSVVVEAAEDDCANATGGATGEGADGVLYSTWVKSVAADASLGA